MNYNTTIDQTEIESIGRMLNISFFELNENNAIRYTQEICTLLQPYLQSMVKYEVGQVIDQYELEMKELRAENESLNDDLEYNKRQVFELEKILDECENESV